MARGVLGRVAIRDAVGRANPNHTKSEIKHTMSKHALKAAGWLAALLVFAGRSSAELKLNENVSLAGYVTGTAYRSAGDFDGGGDFSDSNMELDSYKLATIARLGQTFGYVSLHAFANSDPVFLDAYATYDAGGGTKVTFGKFLSYLGFEAFDYPNMLQISYANALGAFIPAYHSGVRFDYAGEGFSAGVAVLDSVYGPAYYQGDRDLDNGLGFEGFLKFTAGSWTTFAAIAFDGDDIGGDQTTYDIWTQYVLGKTTLAAEYCFSDIDRVGDGHFWLLLAMQSFGKWSVTGRLSGGEDDTVAPGAKFSKYTISPAITLTDNLGFLFEYSWTKYKNTLALDNQSYLAGQFVFKF